MHNIYLPSVSLYFWRNIDLQIQVLGFQHLDYVAAAVQSAGEPSTGLAFLDRYSIIVLGDLSRVGAGVGFSLRG